jgi:hypothetical protein
MTLSAKKIYQPQTKLAVLHKLYDLYDQFVSTFNLACQKGCAACCTANVTLTTFEGLNIVTHLQANRQVSLLKNLAQNRSKRRFRPRTTINQIAALLKSGKPVEPEESDPASGVCPLLVKNTCPIYPVRPFGCRCLVSSHDCRKHGWAQIDPFILTVNNVFMQVIEHVDAGGRTGNLRDVLLFLEASRPIENSKTSDSNADGLLIVNHPMTVLMIPPEHRGKIAPLLSQLRAIKP